MAFVDPATVVIDMPLQSMTARSISLLGAPAAARSITTRIVGRGFEPRKDPLQDGVRIEAAAAAAGRFDITLRLEPAVFDIDRVVIVDIHGDTLADRRR